MTTVNYPVPVLVNGYRCQNCSQVDEAKKNIDPQNPAAGSYGINAKNELPSPTRPQPAAGTGVKLDLVV
jgi:hypothetical protein